MPLPQKYVQDSTDHAHTAHTKHTTYMTTVKGCTHSLHPITNGIVMIIIIMRIIMGQVVRANTTVCYSQIGMFDIIMQNL